MKLWSCSIIHPVLSTNHTTNTLTMHALFIFYLSMQAGDLEGCPDTLVAAARTAAEEKAGEVGE